MPVGKEANARSRPAEGRPSAQRMHQVARRQPEEEPQGSLSQASSRQRITVPRVPYQQRFHPVINQQTGSLGHRVVLPRSSGATQQQTLRLPPVVAMTPLPPPRSQTPMSSSRRLPTVARRQEPRQQPAAQQEPPRSRAAGTSTRTATVQAAKSSKAPATQPTLRNAGRVAEHLPAMLTTGSKDSLNTRSLGLHHKVLPQRLPPLPSKINPREQPKGSCLPRATKEKLAPLPPAAPARASHGFGKQEPTAQRQRQAPAPQSGRGFKAALQVTGTGKERKPLLPPVAVPQKTKKRQVEQKDMTKSLPGAKVAMPPATLKSPGAAKPQGEHSRTLACLAADEGKAAAALAEIPGAEAVTPHLAPAAHKEGDAAASPLPQDAQHPVTEARAGGTTDTEVQEGAASPGLRVGGRFLVLPKTEERRAGLHGQLDGPEERDLQHRHEEPRAGKEQEEEDQGREEDRELSQLQDATNCNIWIKASILEIFQPPDVDPLKGNDDEGEAAASPSAHDSDCQVSHTHQAGTGDPEVLEADPDPQGCLAGTLLVPPVPSR
ncbi:serine/arginine repetitive matrix protein 1-like [Pezoporus flaviventris]|uniref:serine/arginine repetitive matrix protein 1-like n=1 Tax=Pezoporus flaviventris TaxID=889875 RepID=UPI002AB2FC2E|nr:serine/arginine repetitive matrix protein 1-like [Pezoporus flaviventris]